MRSTYVRRSDFEMQRNAEIGLSTEPSKFKLAVTDTVVVFPEIILKTTSKRVYLPDNYF